MAHSLKALSPSALMVALCVGCGRQIPPENVVDELPPWMTRGEEVRTEVAKKLMETGNHVGALDLVRQMRQEGYSSGEIDLLQGEAMMSTGLQSEAEDMLMAAAKALPKDARPYEQMCVLYADTKRIPEAIEACTQATEYDEDAATGWNNLGFLLLASGDVEEALAACKRAVALDSTQSRYRNNLAMAQAAGGSSDQAYRTFQATMPRADAAYMVGLTVERFQGEAPARLWYEQALEHDATHADAKLRLTEALPVSTAPQAPAPGESGGLDTPTSEDP